MSGKKLLLFIGLLILILIIAILLYRRAAALDNLEARQNVTEQTDQSRVAADMKIAASSDDKDAAGPVAAGEKSHEDSTLRKTEKDKSQEPEDTGGSIFGRVVHAETGEPVKGAMVRLISLKFGSKNRTTASDADGNFRFSELPDATYTYYASAEELISYTAKKDVPRQKIDEETRSVGPVVLKMFRAHQLVLSVVSEETGAGIPDASVILGRGVRDVHRTDKGGRITLNLSPEIWDVRAVATGYAEVSRSLDLANNRKTAFQIALPPGGILKGVVVNQDGMPVEKARVGALGGRSLSAESDIDGKYQLEGLALDKSYRVNVYCKGYRGAFFDKVTFEEGSAEIVKDFTLTPQGDHDLVMVGRILDKEDNPLAGVSLQIWGNEETLTESKADGSYRMTLTRNRYHRYHVLLKKDGYASISSNFRGTLKEDKIHQDFVMEPAHSLGGRVLDSAGNPIDQVTISARTKGAYGMFRPLGNDSVKTDADGWFSMENLGEEVELDVSKRGYTRKRVPVTVDRDDLEIVLDGLGRIEGKVIDENGRPVTAFNVKINNMDRRQMLSNYSWGQQGVDFKSGEGRFTLTDLQMSEKKLIIQPVDGAAAGFENVAPAEDPEIRVFEIGASGISLAGTIQDVHGSPLTGIRVGLIVYQKDASTMRYFDWRMWDMNYYERQALSIERMVTTNDGAFHFKNLPKDSQADIILEGQGWTRRHEPKVLNRPEETWENLILTLKRESKIVVHVNREVYESGNIRIYGGSRYSDNTPLEPNRETYEFKALSAGEYTVYMNATGKDQVDTGKQVSLAEGETATVELGFDPTYTISGKAFVAGMPAAGYGLLLAVPGDESRFSRRLVPVADDGSFTFKQVKSGTYHLVPTGPTERSLRTVAIQHPNRIALEVLDSDITDTFNFDRNGSLFGRMASGADYDSIRLTGKFDGRRYIRQIPVSAEARFHIPDVPIGEYQLTGERMHGGSDVLVTEILMDGIDLDVGEIGGKYPGKIQIDFVGETNLQCYYDIKLYRGQYPDTASLAGQLPEINRRAYNRTDFMLLENIPEGTWTLAARALSCGATLSPSLKTIDVSGDVTTQIHLELRSITELTFYLSNTPGKLAEARLVHSETGEVIQIPKLDSPGFPGANTANGVGFYHRSGFARGIAEGKWQLTVRDEDAREKTVHISLSLGKAVRQTIDLNN